MRAADQTGYPGMYWLARRETLRVTKLWTQTILAPAQPDEARHDAIALT